MTPIPIWIWLPFLIAICSFLGCVAFSVGVAYDALSPQTTEKYREFPE